MSDTNNETKAPSFSGDGIWGKREDVTESDDGNTTTDRPEDKTENKSEDKPEDKTESKSETESSETESDSTSDKSETETSESETDSENLTAEDMTVEKIKELISKTKPLPEGTDSNLIELAKTQMKLEDSEKERDKLREYLDNNAGELLTGKQKEELSTLLNTEGEDAYFAKRTALEKEAREARLNNPEFRAEATKLSRHETYEAYRKEHGLDDANFKRLVSAEDYDACEKKEITFEELLKRTHDTYKKVHSGERIFKGKPAPKKVEGSSSKGSSTVKGEWSWPS